MFGDSASLNFKSCRSYPFLDYPACFFFLANIPFTWIATRSLAGVKRRREELAEEREYYDHTGGWIAAGEEDGYDLNSSFINDMDEGEEEGGTRMQPPVSVTFTTPVKARPSLLDAVYDVNLPGSQRHKIRSLLVEVRYGHKLGICGGDEGNGVFRVVIEVNDPEELGAEMARIDRELVKAIEKHNYMCSWDYVSL